LGEGLITLQYKQLVYYEMLYRASELAGSCEHNNEPSGSIKGGELVDWLGDCWLLKKDSAP
jgi:hypothetical protein